MSAQQFALLAQDSNFGGLCRQQITKTIVEALKYIEGGQGDFVEGRLFYNYTQHFPRWSCAGRFEDDLGINISFVLFEQESSEEMSLTHFTIIPVSKSKNTDIWEQVVPEDDAFNWFNMAAGTSLSLDKNEDWVEDSIESRIILDDYLYRKLIEATNEFMWWLDEELENNTGIYAISWAARDRPYYYGESAQHLGVSSGWGRLRDFEFDEEQSEQSDGGNSDELEVEEITFPDGTILFRDDNGIYYDTITTDVVEVDDKYGQIKNQ